MNKQTIEELIKFFELKKLPDIASSLKQEMKSLVIPNKKDSKNKENEEKLLTVLKKAIKKEEERK